MSEGKGRNLVLAATLQNKGWQLLELLYHNQGDESVRLVTDAYALKLAASVPGLVPSSVCSGTRQGQR